MCRKKSTYIKISLVYKVNYSIILIGVNVFIYGLAKGEGYGK